jgi:hypothetical protein
MSIVVAQFLAIPLFHFILRDLGVPLPCLHTIDHGWKLDECRSLCCSRAACVGIERWGSPFFQEYYSGGRPPTGTILHSQRIFLTIARDVLIRDSYGIHTWLFDPQKLRSTGQEISSWMMERSGPSRRRPRLVTFPGAAVSALFWRMHAGESSGLMFFGNCSLPSLVVA